MQSEYLFKSPFTGSGCIVTSDGLFTLNIKSHPGLTDSTILQGLTEDPHLSGSEMSLDTDNDTQSDDDMPLSKIREQFKASKIPLSKISVNMNVPSGIMTSEKGQTCIAQPSVSQVDSNAQTKICTTQSQCEFEAYLETVAIETNTSESVTDVSTPTQSQYLSEPDSDSFSSQGKRGRKRFRNTEKWQRNIIKTKRNLRGASGK